MTDTAQNGTPPSLAGAEWLARPATQAVLAALEVAGHEARAVGGVVRNALMGLPVTDIDIATPARPEAVIAACTAAGLKCVPTGLEHGTVTVVASHAAYEVTTLRRDVETDGRRAVVAFTDDWAADASRRDFTMNALYCDRHGRVLDPLGGYRDVARRRVRFIGEADQRIAEDYLRILRFFRFHATLGEGAPDRQGLEACVRGRRGLAGLSAERVRGEMVRLVTGPRAVEAVSAMIDFGLLAGLLGAAPRPGLLAAVAAAEAAVAAPPDAMLRLSALALACEEDVPRLAGRLRLANAERDSLSVIDLALARGLESLDERSARRLLYRLGPDAWRRRVLGGLAQAGGDGALRRLYRLPERWPLPRLPVRGADVLSHGVPPGPRVGAILAAVESWWIEADFPPEEQVRARLAACIAE